MIERTAAQRHQALAGPRQHWPHVVPPRHRAESLADYTPVDVDQALAWLDEVHPDEVTR